MADDKFRAEFDYEICNSRVRPLADALVKKYSELHHIDIDKILFITNHKSGGGRKTLLLAKTYKMPPKWTELLYQLGACSYFYVIEFIAKSTAAMDESQMVALVYRELRKIGPEGELLEYDIKDWWQILMGLGRNWFYPDNTCPNLLDDSIDWKKLMGQYYEPVKESE